MAYGYQLVGRASHCPAGFIPSLIGVLKDQEGTCGEDMYFSGEEVSLTPGSITSIATTRWVSYDSPPSGWDPILTVKGRGFSFYITASELRTAVDELGDPDTTAMFKAVVR